MILDTWSQLLSFPLRFAVLTVCLFCCLRAAWNFTTNRYTGEAQTNSVSVMILCQLFVCYSWEDDLEVMQLLSQGFWKYIVRQWETGRRKEWEDTATESHCYRNFDISPALKNPITSCWPVSKVTSGYYQNFGLCWAKINLHILTVWEHVQLLRILRHDYHKLKSNLRQSCTQ